MVKSAAIMVLTAHAIFAQTPLALVDKSPQDAPVSLSGTATTGSDPQSRLTFRISVRNLSEKDIILRVLRIEIFEPSQQNGPRSVVRSDECFFGSQLFAAHSTDTIEEAPYSPYEQPTPSVVEVASVFVQFADGSTWGDPDEGEEALADREVILKELADLAMTYQTEGAAQFGSLLMKLRPDGMINQLRSSYQATGDAESTMKLLNQTLQNAESHLQGMRKAAG